MLEMVSFICQIDTNIKPPRKEINEELSRLVWHVSMSMGIIVITLIALALFPRIF